MLRFIQYLLPKQHSVLSLPLAMLGGAALSFIGGERRNKAQVNSARAQMDFQERMSNTAHQRQIKDLHEAGLNPILSTKYGGSSSPGGAQAQIQDTMSPAVNTGLGAMLNAQNLKNLAATESLTTAQEVKVEQETKNLAADFHMKNLRGIASQTFLDQVKQVVKTLGINQTAINATYAELAKAGTSAANQAFQTIEQVLKSIENATSKGVAAMIYESMFGEPYLSPQQKAAVKKSTAAAEQTITSAKGVKRQHTREVKRIKKSRFARSTTPVEWDASP